MYKKLFRPPVLLLLIIISLLLIIAWAKEPEKKGVNDKKENQTIIYSLLSSPNTMDPALNTDPQAATILVNAFEGLMTIGKNQRIIPGVAEQWEISKDGLEYTFRLRSNARWSDGRSVKASDFEYAWKRTLSPELSSKNAYKLYPIKNAKEYHRGIVDENMVGVKALGEHTLKVTLERRTDYFLSLTSLPAYFPLRKDMVEKDIKWELNAGSYLVNGPFKMREWLPGKLLIFEKNEQYWAADKVNLEVIQYEILESGENFLNRFLSGNTHLAYVLPTDRSFELEKESTGKTQPHTSMIFFSINLKHKALGDTRVRQALSMSIDRDRLSKDLYRERLIPASSFVPPSILDNRGETFARRKLYETSGDVTKARQLLKAAGFPEGEGFPKLSLLYKRGSDDESLIRAIANMWQENLNIQVELIEESDQAFEKRVITQDYSIAAYNKDSDFLTPEVYLSMWLTNSSENLGGYSSREYDRNINIALEERDSLRQSKHYHAAMDILAEDMPIIPLFYKSNILYINDNIKGAINYPLGYVYLSEAYLDRKIMP